MNEISIQGGTRVELQILDKGGEIRHTLSVQIGAYEGPVGAPGGPEGRGVLLGDLRDSREEEGQPGPKFYHGYKDTALELVAAHLSIGMTPTQGQLMDRGPIGVNINGKFYRLGDILAVEGRPFGVTMTMETWFGWIVFRPARNVRVNEQDVPNEAQWVFAVSPTTGFERGGG